MARRKFRTPPTLPEDTQCRGLVIPSSKEWLGLYSDALLELTKTYNYNQIEATDLTPEETAALVYDQYVAWLAATCEAECPPVVLPSGSKIYRKSPTNGHIEYLAEDGSGDWLEPSGDDALPSPTSRTEPTEADRLCAAATNAVECIRATLETVLDEWNASSEPAQAITTMVTAIVGWAGATFYPPMLGFVLLAEAAFNIFYEMMDVISWNFWDGDFEDALICSFRSNATDTSGTITFDMDAIVADLWEQIWTRGEYVLLVTQVQYLLSIIGQQALDMAGTTTSVQGNCSGCATWCMEWTTANSLLGNGQWTIFEGALLQNGEIEWVYYTPAFDGAYRRIGLSMNNVDLSQTVITSMWADVYKPLSGANAYLYFTASNSTGFDSPTYQYFTVNNGWRNTGLQAGDMTLGTTSDLMVRLTSNDTTAWRLRGVRLMGTGVNPFGASNC